MFTIKSNKGIIITHRHVTDYFLEIWIQLKNLIVLKLLKILLIQKIIR